MTRQVGSVSMQIGEGGGPVPVTSGEEGQPALLGVTAPELLGFLVDPIDERLRPTRLCDK